VTAVELRRHMTAIGRESWLLFLAISFANASNYVFHVVISRMLTPAEYGALGAVLAILIFLSVPLGAVQTTIAKRLAESRDSVTGGQSQWYRLIRTVAPVAIGLSLILALVGPLVGAFLRLDSAWTTIFVAMYVTPAVLLTVLRGVLQGQMRFKELAFVSAFPMIMRLAIAVPLVTAGGGVAGAVGASVVAETLGLLAAVCLLWRKEPPISGTRDWSVLREVLPITAGLAAMWLFVELDLVLARHFLGGREAGGYAAAGLLARAVLFVPGAVSLVALPHFSRSRGRGPDAYGWLMSSSVIVVALGALVAAVLAIGSDPIMRLTFGDRYAGSAGLLPFLSLAMVGMGLTNLLVFFHIAAGTRMYQLVWLLAMMEALLVALLHGSGEAIALVVLILAWAAAVSALLTARSIASSFSASFLLPDDLSIHSNGTQGRSVPQLSLIIPSYNGGSTLTETVRSTVATLEDTNRSYEVIVVSDGSTDGCEAEVIEAAGSIDVLHYTQRQGKGVALRVGMTRARGEYVAFLDGDGDLDPGELNGFLVLMDLYEPDLVIGSKRHPLSIVEYPPARRVMSWLYQHLVRILFGLNVRDTQTGMKLVRREVLDAVLPRMLEKRFAFDLEFLVVAKRAGYKRFFEAPVRLNYRFRSTISLRAAFRILLDTAAIFYRRYLLRFYDLPGPERPVGAPAYPAQLSTALERTAGP
jgi:O-antigen/teichoic acid export membrane protein